MMLPEAFELIEQLPSKADTCPGFTIAAKEVTVIIKVSGEAVSGWKPATLLAKVVKIPAVLKCPRT